MKKIITLCLVVGLMLPSCSTLKQLGIEPTSLETITALRDVLDSSAFRAAKTLGKMQMDGPESIVPKEVAMVLGKLKGLGIGGDVDMVTKKVGEISGLVAEEGAFIMKDAIKNVNFGDAASIVLYGEDAATQALRNSMYKTVKQRYSERLDTEFAKVPELQYWGAAKSAFNLFAKKDDKIDGTLSDFASERMVDAMFLAMGKEEKEIRKDPASVGKAVVTKVFNYYQKKKQLGS